MKSLRSLLSCNSGFTIMEIMVASWLGLVVLGISMSTFISNRRLLRYDMERTTLTQNLRSALNIIGINTRLAGENLSSAFPAIEVIPGVGMAPDQLVLRRNLRDEILKLCDNITFGSDPLIFGNGSGTAGCAYSDQTHNLNSWHQYRVDEGMGTSKGYIYDPATDTGEFFQWGNETDNGTEMQIELSGTNWQRNYAVGQTAAYILEEWRFYLEDGILKMVTNRDDANPVNIIFDITDLQVQANMQDGTVQTDFDETDDWTKLQSIQVSLTTKSSVMKRDVERTAIGNFFPRNILSN